MCTRMGEVCGYLPLCASGYYKAFAHVGGVTAECINYCDGDGGSIQVDRFPGLSHCHIILDAG